MLLLFTNSLSEPHVSEHVDPSIGSQDVSEYDNVVGSRLTVGGAVDALVGALVDDNNNDDGDIDIDDEVTVDALVGALVDDNNDDGDDDDNGSDKSTYLDDNDGDNDSDDDDDDDDGDNDSDNDDLLELMVGGKERMVSRNKLGLSVGKVVVLFDA